VRPPPGEIFLLICNFFSMNFLNFNLMIWFCSMSLFLNLDVFIFQVCLENDV